MTFLNYFYRKLGKNSKSIIEYKHSESKFKNPYLNNLIILKNENKDYTENECNFTCVNTKNTDVIEKLSIKKAKIINYSKGNRTNLIERESIITNLDLRSLPKFFGKANTKEYNNSKRRFRSKSSIDSNIFESQCDQIENNPKIENSNSQLVSGKLFYKHHY